MWVGRCTAFAAALVAGCGSAAKPAPAADDGPPALWDRNLGLGRAAAVAVDRDGNVVVAGGADQPPTGTQGAGDPAPRAIMVVKLAPGGAELWRARFGGLGHDTARAVAIDGAGNVIVAAEFTSLTLDFGNAGLVSNRGGGDAVVFKLSAAGQPIWAHASGARPDGLAVAVGPTDDIYVTGAFVGTPNFGGGPLGDGGPDAHAVVARLASSGVHSWSRRLPGRFASGALALATDADDAVYLTGWFAGSLDLGGGALAGVVASDPAAATVFAGKLDATGAHVWSRALERGHGRGVALDRDGAVLIAGDVQTRGDQDAFATKLDARGADVWTRAFGDRDDQRAEQIAALPDGSVLFTGEFQGEMDMGAGALVSARGAHRGLQDIFLARIARDGGPAWSRRFGDARDNQGGSGVAVDGSGDLLLAGWFGSTVDFGAGTLATGARVDPGAQWGSQTAGFVAKFPGATAP